MARLFGWLALLPCRQEGWRSALSVVTSMACIGQAHAAMWIASSLSCGSPASLWPSSFSANVFGAISTQRPNPKHRSWSTRTFMILPSLCSNGEVFADAEFFQAFRAAFQADAALLDAVLREFDSGGSRSVDGDDSRIEPLPDTQRCV